jgi:hypothetical protein
VVLWELLTARRLFKSVNELATLQETLRGDIRPPSQVAPDISPELDAIVMRALQREVSQRYPSAAAFKLDLERYLARVDPPVDRRAIAALMKERFGQIIEIHRQKLRDCVAAVAEGEGDKSVERLVASATASSEMAMHTPSAISLPPGDGGTYTPSGVGPTPLAMQGLAPATSPTPSPHRALGSVSITPTPITDEPSDETIRVPPRPMRAPPAHVEKERKRRALAWWLVGLGLAVVGAVLLAIRFGPETMTLPTLPEAEPAPETVTARVIGGAPAVEAPPVVDPTVAPAPAIDMPPSPSTGERSGRSGRRDRSRETATTEPAADPTPVAPTPPTPPAAATEEAAGDYGYLALATSPWTSVTWNGTSLGDTPLTHTRMPVGHHTLHLDNAAEDIHETYEVDIRAGETTRARLGLR